MNLWRNFRDAAPVKSLFRRGLPRLDCRESSCRETGKTLIQHTYEAAKRAARPLGICVAADHAEIYDEVQSFGGTVYMTDPNAASGTDRVAEVARKMPDIDIIVNVQGDEPEIAGDSIDLAIGLLEENPNAVMSTLATPIRNRRQLNDPACVKVVFDHAGQCVVFQPQHDPLSSPLGRRPPGNRPRRLNFYQHVGLYAYRREFLLQLATMSPSQLEQIEKLEQLRVLAGGLFHLGRRG